MRASFYVMGPLLARFGEARVSLPGGCAWGPRPVDYHLKGFEKLGAEIILEDGYIIARAKKLKGAKIHFEIPSVGATGNILMAAVLAEGTTQITNAAREPHIVQLCDVLNDMGAQIEGVETHELTIHGVNSLNPIEVKIIPDMIEAGTFLMAGAILGNITLNNASPDHLSIVLQKLEQAGCTISVNDDTISIAKADNLEAVDMMTDVYPSFPTDLQAQWIAIMSVASGTSVITDTIYHDRFSHVPELVRLGANISMENNVAIVRGVDELLGAQVMSTDIRASASLLIAALMAKGKSTISRVYHIDRGYEKIEEKFKCLGADIHRECD
jgi:UDP-N-acetylglucosamine 1-carboxyvinyltransferase